MAEPHSDVASAKMEETDEAELRRTKEKLAAMEKELSEVRLRTLHGMVQKHQLVLGGISATRHSIFLKRGVAFEMSRADIPKLVDAMGLTKQKLIFRLSTSASGLARSILQRKRKLWSRVGYHYAQKGGGNPISQEAMEQALKDAFSPKESVDLSNWAPIRRLQVFFEEAKRPSEVTEDGLLTAEGLAHLLDDCAGQWGFAFLENNMTHEEIKTQREAEWRMQVLMRTVILPLAMRTNAVFMIDSLHDMCFIAAALRVCAGPVQEQMGEECPFTVVGNVLVGDVALRALSTSGYALDHQLRSQIDAWRLSSIWPSTWREAMTPYGWMTSTGTGAASIGVQDHAAYSTTPFVTHIIIHEDKESMQHFNDMLLDSLNQTYPIIQLQGRQPRAGDYSGLAGTARLGFPIILMDSDNYFGVPDDEEGSKRENAAQKSDGGSSVLPPSTAAAVDEQAGPHDAVPQSSDGVSSILPPATAAAVEAVVESTKEKSDSLLLYRKFQWNLILMLKNIVQQTEASGHLSGKQLQGLPLWHAINMAGELEARRQSGTAGASAAELAHIFEHLSDKWSTVRRNVGRSEFVSRMQKEGTTKGEWFGEEVTWEEMFRRDELWNQLSSIHRRQERLSAVHGLLANPSVHSLDVRDTETFSSVLQGMTHAERTKDSHSLEGLRLLRAAYDRIDIFHAEARKNKMLSKLAYAILLLANLAVIVLNTTNMEVDFIALPGANGSTSAYESARADLKKYPILALAVFNSAAAGIITMLNPLTKWKTLRSTANMLTSQVFHFRTRTGPYAPRYGMRAVDSDTRALRAFASTIQHATESVFETGDVAETAFFARHRASVAKHGQYRDSADDTSLWLARSSKVSPALMALNVDLGREDDHHTPLTNELYIRFRLRPSIEFYQRRLPRVYRAAFLLQLLLIGFSSASIVLAATSLPQWTSLVAGLVGTVTAWSEFSEYSKKLRAYSRLVKLLTNHLVWWDTLPLTDRALPSNCAQLVEVAEAAMNTMNENWSGSATLQHRMLVRAAGGESRSSAGTEKGAGDSMAARKHDEVRTTSTTHRD